jgi:hypothetical protein
LSSTKLTFLVNTKQAGYFPQIFPNWRLSPNSGKSRDFCPLVESLKTLSYLDKVFCSMNRPQVRSHFGESNAALHIFVSELGRWKEEDVICRNNRAFVLRIRSDVESFFNIFVAEISKTLVFPHISPISIFFEPYLLHLRAEKNRKRFLKCFSR